MKPALYFIEHLTLRIWVFNLWPRLFWSRLRQENRVIRCYVIDGSQLSMLIARGSAWVIGTAAEKLAFSLVDLRDESGTLIGLRIPYQDMWEVQQNAMEQPVYQALIRQGLLQDRVPIFLAKSIASITWNDGTNMWRALLLVQVSAWKTKQTENAGAVPFLVLTRRPWLKAITNYAHQNGVTIVPVRPSVNLQTILRRRIPPVVVSGLRLLRYRLRQRGLLGSVQSLFWPEPKSKGTDDLSALNLQSGNTTPDPAPRIAVEYYGQLNLNHPKLHSNLFFWQESSIPGRDLLLIFSYPADPLDQQKWAELKQHDIGAVVLHPGATTISGQPVFNHRIKRKEKSGRPIPGSGYEPESRWLNQQIASYHALRSYWTDLFAAHHVMVYVTWYKYDANHCAIADALQSLGGITAIYQRAYESHPSPETTVGADIVFGFSPK
ncbi:MAG: hypothetical protein O2909_12505, partial [Chloroflexi bacterium]|nr:hypothetical protein [Chloroflexota bacterium]